MREARILVVDDQAANLKLMERMLRQAGYVDVRGVDDPREAVLLYRESGFDLVLLDIRMPGMDGFQVMEELKAVEGDRYIPVLVLTAQTDRETRVKALEAGAKDFISKPFDRIEFLSRIYNMLEVRLLHNEVKRRNQVLEERVWERTRELHQTRLEVIRRLGRASEYRDNETGLHILRMSQWAERIGRAAGLRDGECDTLLNASPMHDVGKLGIPDRVLLKPGKLDPEEWAIMKTHTTIGAELLSGNDSDLLEVARLIALTHHERWDGGGYPQGLSGVGIPLLARITTLADVFDALLARRPYKEAWPVERAVAEIRRESGRQFDPDLVEVFTGILPELLAIHRELAEPR
ncbi:MAG: response regulator [Magnetococcales bacterium]|nr:response regulator [Magnetococcales bacterium]MBF0156634.1 response regulator [Magnetococcales bacterium]